MKAESAIKPPVDKNFLIEHTGNGKCTLHFYENTVEKTTDEGDTVYSFDRYSLEDIPYHDNLEGNIRACETAWLEKAKENEKAEPEYTEHQILEQNITELMLENIEQGQQITELELLILGGNK